MLFLAALFSSLLPVLLLPAPFFRVLWADTELPLAWPAPHVVCRQESEACRLAMDSIP